MKGLTALLCTLPLCWPVSSSAQQEEKYDYWQFNRNMIRYGQQAIFMCNGLFTSNRTLEQVFKQELAFLPQPVGTPSGGDYVVDWERRAVAIGAPGGTPIMRAAFRTGIGCVIMAPDQTFDDIESLPILDMPPPPGNPATIAWPDGDFTAPDFQPALGPVQAVPGLYIAAGYSGHGFKLSPAVGHLMADWILDGEPSFVDLSMFNVERFGRGELIESSGGYESRTLA